MSRPSRSVYTVTRSTYLTSNDDSSEIRSTYLPSKDEMSEIAYIDVDDDDDYADTDLSSSSSSVKPATQGNLYEAKRQVSDYQRDLSERGVFDYYTVAHSSTNRAQEPSFRPQNHYYLGPGGAASLRSSGARKFVEAHRQADTTTSSDEEVRGGTYEPRWLASSHEPDVHDTPSLDSQWVRQQYNQHVKRANTQCYDEAVPCDEPDDYLTENRPLSSVTSKQADHKDFLSSRSSMRDSEHVLSRHTRGDTSHDLCDSIERLKLIKDADSYRDNTTVRSDATDTSCAADHRSGSPATHSFLPRSGGRSSKDVCDTASHLSSSGQSWPIMARSCDSYGSPVPGSHQNAVCRSSELSTVVSAVGSVRCSTGVDTGVGFPLSTVSSRSAQGHMDSSRLSSSGQSTVTSGLDRTRWAASNGLQAIADYCKSHEDAGPRNYVGRSARYEHLTYGSRGNDSDGDDDQRRSDADIASNVDILQRRGKDYDCGSNARPFVNTPQYHLMPTEEEETERRQSAKGQQLERMQRRRNARLNRQSAGVSKADTVPGFRGEASLEELINYIDAPAMTASDCKTARKTKKKKKKVLTADSSDAGVQKLANSCEVFVGTSGVSSDEPSVRVGDSCYIELRKKSDYDSLPETTSTPVDQSIYSSDSHTCFDLSEGDNNIVAINTVADDCVADGQNAVTCTDTNHLNVELVEDLPEVVYAEVKTTLLEEESVLENFTASVTTAAAAEETVVIGLEASLDNPVGNINGNHTATDMELMSVESGNTANMTDDVCILVTESSSENIGTVLPAVTDRQHGLDDILPLLPASDSVTSDTGSIEDLFVTVQKKKRAKNPAVAAEDTRQRFDRKSSVKSAEDRDVSYYVKRSWVKSSDAASVVPSISVSRSSIVYSRPSCPVNQRSGVAVARYNQASHPDTVSSSAVAEKCKEDISSSSAVTVKAETEGITEQNGKGKSAVKDAVHMSVRRNSTDVICRSDKNDKKEFERDSVTAIDSRASADGIITTHWQASGQKTLLTECDKKTDSRALSDTSTGTEVATSCDSNVKQNPSIEVTVGNELSDSVLKTDIPVLSMDNNPDMSLQPGEGQLVEVQSSEGKDKSAQPSVSASDVFLDTRNIAGTTPPRSDISFGFDPSTPPEPSEVPVSQHDNLLGGTFNPVAAASCHCPVVAPMPPPVAGCAPILYFYPAVPMPILPPLAPFTTGRCTPIGVVPPMPAVADMSQLTVAAPAWQSAEDKLVPVPVVQDNQATAANDDTVTSDTTVPSTSNRATNEFVLYAAQRYLYAGLPGECLVVHYSSIEAVQQQQQQQH